MTAANATLAPHHLLQDYWRAYRLAFGKQPTVRYVGNQWYLLNGELVHRSDIELETTRLNSLARQRHLHNADKGMIQRMIARLRNL